MPLITPAETAERLALSILIGGCVRGAFFFTAQILAFKAFGSNGWPFVVAIAGLSYALGVVVEHQALAAVTLVRAVYEAIDKPIPAEESKVKPLWRVTLVGLLNQALAIALAGFIAGL